MSLALACDLVFASESASFSAVFSRRGLVPDAGAAFRLVRFVGVAKAKELAFSGRSIGAVEALQIGLVQRVHRPRFDRTKWWFRCGHPAHTRRP